MSRLIWSLWNSAQMLTCCFVCRDNLIHLAVFSQKCTLFSPQHLSDINFCWETKHHTRITQSSKAFVCQRRHKLTSIWGEETEQLSAPWHVVVFIPGIKAKSLKSCLTAGYWSKGNFIFWWRETNTQPWIHRGTKSHRLCSRLTHAAAGDAATMLVICFYSSVAHAPQMLIHL